MNRYKSENKRLEELERELSDLYERIENKIEYDKDLLRVEKYQNLINKMDTFCAELVEFNSSL